MQEIFTENSPFPWVWGWGGRSPTRPGDGSSWVGSPHWKQTREHEGACRGHWVWMRDQKRFAGAPETARGLWKLS